MLFTKLAVAVKWALAAFGLLVLLTLLAIAWLRFPEHDYSLKVPPLSPDQQDLARSLGSHVRRLANEIGARNGSRHPEALARAADYIEATWAAQGFTVTRQVVHSEHGDSPNLIVDLPGRNPLLKEVLIGAHYDTFDESPGANDNGTGVAAMLELSRRFRSPALERSLRFVAFTNEEPPEYRTQAMGSVAYVKEFGDRPLALMLSLETMGFFTEDSESQGYPWPLGLLYPEVGDFIGFVGNLPSRRSTRQLLESFRRVSTFPAGAVTLPDVMDGVGWSDHWAFWENGNPAAMVTDTAIFRYDFYHTRDDTTDKVHFDDLARVVSALEAVLRDPRFDPEGP